MTAAFDPTDVPTVATECLDRVLRHLVETGRGLALLNGLKERELRQVEHAIWTELDIAPADRVAVALRFRALVGAFAARRLKDALMQQGLPLIVKAFKLAAEVRLNAERGFSPFKLKAALAATPGRSIAPARGATEAEVIQLAA